MSDIEQSAQSNDFSPEMVVSGADLMMALIQLGLGGISVGASVVREPSSLRATLSSGEKGQDKAAASWPSDGPEAAAPVQAASPTADRIIDGVVGAALGTQSLVGKGASRAWGFNKRILRAVSTPIRVPMDALGITGLAAGPMGAMTGRAEATVQSLEAAGRAEVERSRQRVGSTLATTIDAIVGYLAYSPAVDSLIRVQVDKLLPLLADHPAVERLIQIQVDKILPVLAESPAIQSLIMAQLDQILPELAGSADIQKLIEAQVGDFLPKLADDFAIQQLIRKQAGAYLLYLMQNSEQIQALIRQQGDIYIDYLNENPDAVQTLVSGQSLGIAGQVMDEVRERTVTARHGCRNPRAEPAAQETAGRCRGAARSGPASRCRRRVAFGLRATEGAGRWQR